MTINEKKIQADQKVVSNATVVNVQKPGAGFEDPTFIKDQPAVTNKVIEPLPSVISDEQKPKSS